MNNIGVLIIATNKYDRFVKPLIESARKHFLTNHKVTYYVFTDSEKLNGLGDDVKIISHEHLKWPLPTLYRYKTFVKHKNNLINEDYLYYCDSDMLFVNTVGDEVLGDRVSTIHPGFMGGRGTPETNSKSLAYVAPNEQLIYYAGGFNGGTSQNFLNMSETIDKNIDIDMEKGIIAIWHDESHMNRYFINNKPTVVLDPSYCYPESWNLKGYTQRLLALDKNHSEMRS
jgi:histo-blood group ABO system transferase